MATNRIIPPPEQPSPQLVREDSAAAQNELEQVRERRFRNTLRAGAVAEVVIGIIAVLAICYLAKIVLVTLLISLLIAFTLEPLVGLLQRWRMPRSAAAFVAVLLLCGAVWAASYFFYNRAVDFAHELPRYSQKIRGKLGRITKQTSDIKQTTQNILPGQAQKNKNAVPVKVESTGGSEFFTKQLGTVTEVLAAIAFIPFLVYFMLSWQEHARTKTVQLFRPENRSTAYVTLGQISLMMRSFIAGNVIIGLFMSAVSITVFGFLGLPYFYFLGLLSGFLSLMPYLGVILAAVPPLAAGLGTLKDTGMIIVVLTVLGLHVFSMNVLYPKVIGKRLQLNPLLVTISLLVWGWIWGALGLVLAVPVMGVVKIVCDHVNALRPFGDWMSE
jgi:predicted PurR-regulated permease PerM